MLILKQQTADLLSSAAAALWPQAPMSAGDLFALLEFPPDPAMGDLALPCFKLARTLRTAPPAIAAALCEACRGDDRYLSVEAVGGYLNFRVNFAAVGRRVCADIALRGEDYGSPHTGEGRTVVLDYSSPNVAKPFHVGHLGTTVIGHSLRLLHEFAGYKCVGINHLGDWGTQFGKLICAYRRWGSKEAVEAREIDELVALYVRFHAEAEADPSLEDEARAEFKKLETGDPDNLALWRWFIDISLREYQKTYRQLGITFDSYNGESFYTDKMPRQIERMREQNLLRIDDGASVVDLSAWNMPPCLILKRDGSTLYPTRDIAAAVYRAETYDFDKCIYVTSAGQSRLFAQWFKVVELMGYPWYDRLVHVPYGTVSINGEKLSTRSGNVILLKDIFRAAIDKVREISIQKNESAEGREEIAEAVGVGAIVFYYLSNNRMRDINLVIEDALSFDGNTGPYAQYTYARTCSILAKVADADASASFDAVAVTAEEADLVRCLALFPERVQAALDEYEPSHVTRYILDLCAAFNRFYHECSILGCEDATTRRSRIALTRCTHTVLGRALTLICLKKTEKI
ncbi:MAG: arginine--tRNA ligase [Clostridia bacterium]|nr:arginine--tRNA ligase [Clostridia bacterium]